MSLMISAGMLSATKAALNAGSDNSSLAGEVGRLALGNAAGDTRPPTARETALLSASTLQSVQNQAVQEQANGLVATTGSTAVDLDQTYDENAQIIVTARKKNTDSMPDFRVRLSALPGKETQVYGKNDRSENVLACLHATNGLLFPYTPQISVSQDVSYQSHDLVHTNSDILSYTRTPSPTISLTGKFTIQNQREGEYAVAALHFLRTVSKMYYGVAAGAMAGVAPPVLRFSGYGDHVFNEDRVVLKSHSYSFDEAVDMVSVKLGNGGFARLPALFSVQLTLGMQMTPSRMRNEFDLNAFRTGQLLQKSSGWF